LLRFREIAFVVSLAALLHGASCERASRTVSPQLEAREKPSVTFVAVGDVLLARGVGRRIKQHGLDWPFEKVAATLRSADLAFCNLECPLSVRGVKINKPYCFKADPSTVKCLTNAGFDIVSLANNHAMDCSRTGLVEMMQFLEEPGIRHTGAGDTLADASLPTIVEVNGLRIAFLARNTLFPEGVWLRPNAPGIAPLEPDTIEAEVADAARRADVVIVSLHWGVEYRTQPKESQRELARKLVDAGANLILGHHSHVPQPIEEYHGGVIAYSLGNFLFDSPFKKCTQSMIFKCRLTRSGVSDFEVVPVRIADCRPCPMTSVGTVRRDGFSLSMVAGRG